MENEKRPTREQMIADLQRPTREQMIDDLSSKQQDQETNQLYSPTSDDIGVGGYLNKYSPEIERTIERAIESGRANLSNASKNAAEDLAYSRIGGTSTTEGRKLLKETAKDLYDTLPIDKRDIGRKVLDENLLGSSGLKSTEKASEIVQGKYKSSIKDLEDLLSKPEISSKQIPLEDVYNKYNKEVIGKTSPLVESGRQAQEFAQNEADVFKGKMNPNELEKIKRMEKFSYDPKESGKDLAKNIKKRVLKEAVEESVDKAGLLNEFKNLKQASGEMGLVNDILTSKEAKDQFASGLDKSGLVREGLDRLKGLGAKGLDTARKVLESAPVKMTSKILSKSATPIAIGMGVHDAYDGYTGAKERGASTLDATASGLKSAAEGFVPSPIKDALQETEKLREANVKELLKGTENTPDVLRNVIHKILSPFNKDNSKSNKITEEATARRQAIETLKTKTTKDKKQPLTEVFSQDLQKLQSKSDQSRAAAEYKLLQNPYTRDKLNKLNK